MARLSNFFTPVFKTVDTFPFPWFVCSLAAHTIIGLLFVTNLFVNIVDYMS